MPAEIYISGSWFMLTPLTKNTPNSGSMNPISNFSGSSGGSQTQIILTWTSYSQGQTALWLFKDDVYHSGLSSGANTATVTGLTAGTTYKFKILAYNTAVDASAFEKMHVEGAAAFCSAFTAAPVTGLNAPTMVSYYAVNSSQAYLSWTDNSTVEQGNKIYKKPLSASTYTLIHTTAANTNNYTVTGSLSPSSTYQFYVAAYSASLQVSSSVVQVTTPADGGGSPSTPTSFTVTGVTSTTISLSWAYAGNAPDGFKIYRNGSLITTKATGDRSHTDTGLTANTSYDYTITAYIGAEESSAAAVTGTTALSQLTAPSSCTSVDQSSCDFTKDPDVASYSVLVSWGNGDATATTKVTKNGTIVWTASAGETSVNLNPGGAGTYTFAVYHVKTGYADSNSTAASALVVNNPCSL